MLNISTGMTKIITSDTTDPPVPKYFHYNWIVYWGTPIKEKVKVSVIAGNGILTPLEAAYLVENRLADFVAKGEIITVNTHRWSQQALTWINSR